ncbi:MAG TPA: hypothetical protein VMV57_15400 [Terracidiphilus sp.]|nr:hypothetical protein [Terracidiphilus sp.]
MPHEPGSSTTRTGPLPALCLLVLALVAAALPAQTSAQALAQSSPPTPAAAPAASPIPSSADPIAIVPLDQDKPGSGPTVAGALQVTAGRAVIAVSGTVTSGSQSTDVLLPRRGTLRVCASTSVKLAADSSVPAGDMPGLLMALDHGAVEASFATGPNADILLTPDFRILISGPGAADLKVRLGERGDTCVDNALAPSDRSSSLGWNSGLSAPYVLVTSVFDGSVYRVQPGQRVMFQHGSTREAVDDEKEPCGCPAPVQQGTNEFPLAQSAGLAPLPKPAPSPVVPAGAKPAITAPLVYKSPTAAPAPEPAVTVPSEPAAASVPVSPRPVHAKKPKPHRGFFRSIGRFFKRIFGAE